MRVEYYGVIGVWCDLRYGGSENKFQLECTRSTTRSTTRSRVEVVPVPFTTLRHSSREYTQVKALYLIELSQITKQMLLLNKCQQRDFIHLNEEFHTINQNILISKLSHVGIYGIVLN